ncbi:MAG TPA: phage tail protein [candidate division Zixibacteria bacterium]|nr:phage tail protein [candidate division Zixibacteria bacterium]
MTLMSKMRGDREEERDTKFYGVVVGIVTNIDDPNDLGRIKVSFPWMGDDQESYWARVATLQTGKDYGTWFMPEVGTEVLVAFEHGDVRFPYVLGQLWNGQDDPPEPKSEMEKNTYKMIKSKNRSYIVMVDKNDTVQTNFIMAKVNEDVETTIYLNGEGLVSIEGNKVHIKGNQEIILEAPSVTVDAGTLNLKGSTSVKIEGASIDVKASGILNLKGSLVNIN